MEQKETKDTKTHVYNVVILDKSGSMEYIRQAAIDGFNETLNGIKKSQEKFADTQEHYVTLVAFCECEKQLVYDKVPVAEAKKLTPNDYEPCCGTPLYDAMGITLNRMRKHVKTIENTVVVVTIITDGMENASTEYNGKTIKNLVEQLKSEGWTFTYMGANQDAHEVAVSLSIHNSINFKYSNEGTVASMARDCRSRMGLYASLDNYHKSHKKKSKTNFRQDFETMANDAFDKE